MRALALALTLIASAAPAQTLTEVDVELVLAVDVSRSMTQAELEIQRRGYAEALRSDDVLSAVQSGMLGRIAVTYVEWAGNTSQRVVVPWTLVEDSRDADWIATMIEEHSGGHLRRTSISGALLWAEKAIDTNEFHGLRRVIDVSGDGPNNQGMAVTEARDRVLAHGITINGLPLLTQDDLSMRFGIEDLDVYYRECVTGGPLSFVIPVTEWQAFPRTVRRKLVLEIAAAQPRVWPAQAVGGGRVMDYDCLIGEKLWERNRMLFDMP